MALALLMAVAPAVLIVAALELARVDFSGPLGGLGGRFVEFPDGRIVAVQQWEGYVRRPQGAELRGDFHFEVRGDWRGGGFLLLPVTSRRYAATSFTVTIDGIAGPTTLTNVQISAESPYRKAVGALVRREGSEVFQRAWFDGVPFAERHYFSAFVVVFSMLWPVCWLAVMLRPAIKDTRRTWRIAKGRCGGCGYDIRTAKGKTRCPECGGEVVNTHRWIGEESRRSASDARGEPRG